MVILKKKSEKAQVPWKACLGFRLVPKEEERRKKSHTFLNKSRQAAWKRLYLPRT